MTDTPNVEPGLGGRWSDTLRTRLEAARDSEAQREWARWEAAALRELSKTSLDEVSWELADGVRLPPLLDGSVETVLPSSLDRSAARGPLVRDPQQPWHVLRTRDGRRPDPSGSFSAWEHRLGVTRVSIDATHLAPDALDLSAWGNVLAPGLDKELRVGLWSPSFGAWSEGPVVVDPVAAILAVGGASVTLDQTRTHVLGALGDRLRLGVDARAIHEAGGDAVDELSVALAQVAAWLRAGVGAGRAPTDVFARLDVTVAIGREPLVEIAKLRAVRGAIAALANSCGVNPDLVSLRVTARGSHRELTRRDPWVNLLRGTMVGIAGVLGGVDALEIPTLDALDDEHGEFGARLAIDTHRLLRDEAHLAATADATGGSYAIEAATEALARAAWQRFTEIEVAGGFDAWLAAGELHRLLATRASDMASRVADGNLVSLGTNLHPPKETPSVPKGAWTMRAPSRVEGASGVGDVSALTPISLESLMTARPSHDASASSQGVA